MDHRSHWGVVGVADMHTSWRSSVWPVIRVGEMQAAVRRIGDPARAFGGVCNSNNSAHCNNRLLQSRPAINIAGVASFYRFPGFSHSTPDPTFNRVMSPS